MLWLFLWHLAACPAHPAFWLPQNTTEDNQVRRLPFQPELGVLCCNGEIGVIPENPRHVREVRYHFDTPFALIVVKDAKCPAQKAQRPYAAKVYNDAPEPQQGSDTRDVLTVPLGYTAEPDSRCTTFIKKAKGTRIQCAQLCNQTSDCVAFTYNSPECRLSQKCTALVPALGVEVYKSNTHHSTPHKKNSMRHTTALVVLLILCALGLIVTVASRVL